TIVLFTVATLRLPSSYTLLLGLVDVALVLLLLGTINTSTALTHAGGYVVFAFIAVAVYLYLDLMFTETGGKGLPLGKPVISG
ncbi:GPR1/FUN34/yaaH family protein, partial [Frankia casuarinae]